MGVNLFAYRWRHSFRQLVLRLVGRLESAFLLCAASEASNVVGASRESGPGGSTSPAASSPNKPLRQLGIRRIDSPRMGHGPSCHVDEILGLRSGEVSDTARGPLTTRSAI